MGKRHDDFSAFDDIIIFSDDRFVLKQDLLGNTYYQGRCTKCEAWYDVDFENVIHYIKDAKVGDKDNPTIVEYPYRVDAVIAECEECGYIHVYDANDYKEMKSFKASDATEKCKYRGNYNIVTYLPYKIFDAEIIAKYVLSLVEEMMIYMGYTRDSFTEVRTKLVSGKVIEPCLVAVMMEYLLSHGHCTEKNLSNWYDEGEKHLTKEEKSKWYAVAELLFYQI